MDALTIDTSLERLTKRREQVLTTLRYLDSQQIEVEQNTDWVDQATFESRIALLDGLRQDYQAEMTRIDRAMERIKKHKYGKCAACHEPIEPKRMAIVPDAEYCAACQNFRAGLEHSTA